jgi:hypothetical protein
MPVAVLPCGSSTALNVCFATLCSSTSGRVVRASMHRTVGDARAHHAVRRRGPDAGRRDSDSGGAHVQDDAMANRVDVVVERGEKRLWAIAVGWPGWARTVRASQGEESGLEALTLYRDRFAVICQRAGATLPARPRFAIVERLPGDATTDFGAPGAVAEADAPTTGAATTRDLARQIALLQAAWEVFDEVAAHAPEELRRGPRGGGRTTSAIVAHVVEAERAYARKIGVRHGPYAPDDLAARDAMRHDLVTALRSDDPAASWPARYLLRRTAWHVVDHLWEIEDRSGT